MVNKELNVPAFTYSKALGRVTKSGFTKDTEAALHEKFWNGTPSSFIWNGSDGSLINGRPNLAHFSRVRNGTGLV